MGVHFTVTANHDLKETELEAIRSRFTPLSPLLATLAAQTEPVQWRDASEAGSARPYLFYAPGGFTLNVGPKALRYSRLPMRWAMLPCRTARPPSLL